MTIDNMTANEFAAKAINDKAFLAKICEFIPDEMLQEETPEDTEQQSGGGLAAVMLKYFWPAAQAMGCGFSEDDLEKACKEEVEGLSGFKKAGLLVRFLRSANKVAKARKK